MFDVRGLRVFEANGSVFQDQEFGHVRFSGVAYWVVVPGNFAVIWFSQGLGEQSFLPLA